MIVARPSIPLDAYLLAPNLRKADLAELEAHGRANPLSALLDGLEMGDVCFTILDGAEPVAMFGTASTQYPGLGTIWLLASEGLVKHSRQFLRECRSWVDKLVAPYLKVFNVADARNDVHLTWLKWCKFDFTGDVDINGHRFILFEKTNV